MFFDKKTPVVSSRKKIPGSLRFRFISLYVTIFGITLIGFSALLYQYFIRSHGEDFDVALYNYAVDVAHAIDVNLFGQVTLNPNLLSESEKVFPFALGETFIQVRTITGKAIARSKSLGTGSLPIGKEEQQNLTSRRAILRTIQNDEMNVRPGTHDNFRMISYLIDKPGPNDFILQIAVPMILLEREARGLRTFFVFSIPFVLLISTFGGLYLSRKALAPFNAIIEKTKDITAHGLSERVPVPTAEDEIRELALTLNNLLDRLQESFSAQESFIADASHQIKTPLAILRGEIDLMRNKPRTETEVQEFLQSASQEVSYLSRMVEDLLTLARVEAGGHGLSQNLLRLDEVAMEAISRLKYLALPKKIEIDFNLKEFDQTDRANPNPFEMMADPDLIRSLIENLLENAIKYSPEASRVLVQIVDHPEHSEILVSDQGPGIAADILPKVFDRFYRSETTRDKIAGSGLGLAIAKKIALAHQGTIQALNNPDYGTLFSVQLPKGIKKL